MFSYDDKSRVLKIQKIPEPEMEMNLVEYQKQSYEQFLSKTVTTDLDDLVTVMQDSLPVSAVEGKFCVKGLQRSGYQREVKKQTSRYYSVRAIFKIDGVQYPPGVDSPEDYGAIEVLRIPHMDDDAILNVGGARRILLMQLVAAERVSYDAAKKTVSVTTPRRNISVIFGGSRDVVIKYGKKKIEMHKLLRALNAREKIYPNLSTLFTSPYIMSAFASSEYVTDVAIADMVNKYRILDTYAGVDYELGSTRGALNEALSLDRAKGRVLSRPAGELPAGSVVDEEALRYLRKNLINEIYVQALPDIVGYTLLESVYIDKVPAGTHNNDLLRELIPRFTNHTIIPEDCSGLGLLLERGTSLRQEDIQLLYDVGRRSVHCSRLASGRNGIYATFEEEIIGNCTVRLGDVLGTNIPEGREYDEWIYYYGNKELNPTDCSHLNTHDLAALYSLCTSLRKHPDESFLLDKDAGLLKKVLAANEIFSNSLREVIPQFVRRCRNGMVAGIRGYKLNDSHFYGLTKDWISYMRERGYLDIASTVNPIATISQANRLIMGNQAKEVQDKMRLLYTSYYGRICPYETPSGLKLGITTTKAIGAKVKDGILTTPYRRVLKGSDGRIQGISDTLEYMDAQEEARYRIGDILSLVRREDGSYNDADKVMARIPAPNNQVTIESIDARDLEYVNAFCEQTLSPTAALIPFAGANDSVRVTYATNMLKQSILVQGGQVPRVFTSMYRKCFDHSNTYVIRAKKDGYVDQIPVGKLELNYMDGTFETIDISETLVTGQSVNFLNFRVKEGDHFRKGDVLVDSAMAKEGIYSPGVNLFAAYMADGYNYEDAIELSEYAANQFISISPETVTCRLKRNGSESIRADRQYYYRYIPENGVVANISRQSTDDLRRKSRDVICSGKHSGILYAVERNHDEKRAVEYNAHLLAFNRLRTGDKMSGRHSNKGTSSIIRKSSEMPCFANGRPIDILLNPCGVPSRMNIGQNFEAYLGFVAYLLDVYVESNPFNGATLGDIKLLMRYVYDLANCKDAASVCAKYPMLPSELHAQAISRHSAIREWEGCFDPNGTAMLWNPITGKYIENPVTFGVSYMLKLEHEVNHKIHARAGMLEEDYSQIYKQPTDGAARGGGQKMGEMELCALAAYGATDFLYETCNEMSDNVLERINYTLRTLNLPEYTTFRKSVPHSVEMFRYMLEVLGIKMVDTDDILPECDADSSERRTLPDVRGLLSRGRMADEGICTADTLLSKILEEFG